MHGMFFTVLGTKMRNEEEVGLFLLAEKHTLQRQGYPWYQLQLPCRKTRLTEVPAMGAMPRDRNGEHTSYRLYYSWCESFNCYNRMTAYQIGTSEHASWR